MDTFQQIKDRLTIFDAWERLGLPDPPHRDRVTRSPFREDRKPSFSIFAQGTRWEDKSNGEGGDVTDFWATGRGITLNEAKRELEEILGGTAGNWVAAPRQAPQRQEEKKVLTLPALRKPTAAEIRHIAHLRGVDVAGVAWAAGVGILRIGEHWGYPSWFYLDGPDGSTVIAEARRMDGEGYPTKDGPLKAFTLKGGSKAWPIGASLLFHPRKQWSTVAICEGFCDALAIIGGMVQAGRFDVAPIAILGATARIHPEVVKVLRGKRILIFPHRDQAGEGAAVDWHNQIGMDSKVIHLPEFHQRDGKPGKDLNDLVRAAGGMEALVGILKA